MTAYEVRISDWSSDVCSSDLFRSVFVLRALEDMSVDETADCLGVPAATVRTRYFRAKGLLRASLAREIDFNFETAFGCAGPRCDRIVAGVLTRLRPLPASTTSRDRKRVASGKWVSVRLKPGGR